MVIVMFNTVDRNPAPVEVGSLSSYLQGFSTIPGGFLAGFLNHQQPVPNEGLAFCNPRS